MQAGRELDLKVAEALGWNQTANHCWISRDGWARSEERTFFSTNWGSLGILVDEARIHGIYLDILPNETCYICEAKTISNTIIGKATKSEAPHAACLAFLEAKGITI
ncbi:hypothetical protein [Brevibacillus formosus]|uniref:hypothetical protein n=1 Tax=Brevibacillus formosus TaxID=54913 RepID=UPI003F1B5E7C